MTSPRSPWTKSNWIDKVTKIGDILTGQEIVARVNKEFEEELDGEPLTPRSIGGIIPNYLHHKFRRHPRKGQSSLWEKIAI